jgi:hypothetical protein
MAASSVIASLTSGTLRAFFPLVQKEKATTVAQAVFRSEAEAQEFVESADLSKFNIPLTYKRFREAAVIFAALGILAGAAALVFAPPIAIAAGCLLLLAIGCEVAARDQKNQLDLSLGEQILRYQGQKELLQHKQHDSRLDRLAFVEEYLSREESKKDVGEYTKENLVGYVNEDSHFSVCTDDYRYRIAGIAEKEEPYVKTLHASYVRQFLGSNGDKPEETPVERFKDCIEGNQGPFYEKRALQLSAFLKLLGDHNSAIPHDINDHLAQRQLEMGVVPSTSGQLDVLFAQESLGDQKIIFQVHGERFPVYATENRDQPLGVFQTARQFKVSPPDQNGSVKCSISHSYICLG